MLSVLSLCLAMVSTANVSYAALSTTTANTIQGTRPYLLLSDGITELTNLNELLGFSMPKRDGSGGTEQIDASMAGTALLAPKGMKYSDVIVLVAADGLLHNLSSGLVGDADGDASISGNTSVLGQMRASWYSGENLVTNLNQKLTGCGGPYTLKLEIPEEVSTNTAYGDPNTRLYGKHTGVTYTFMSSEQGICYLQPKSMHIFTGTAGVDIKYAAGYNEAVWQPGSLSPSMGGFLQTGGGFKASAGFPSTGFEKAEFSVIGSGSDQSRYKCTSPDNGIKITLSGTASTQLGTNCTVTYNSATRAGFTAGGTPTINLEYDTGGGRWITIDNYNIPTPVRWR